MQFVDDEVSKRLGSVALPEVALLRPEQHVVQHLVVGQQDIGRIADQRLARVDDFGRRHLVGRVLGALVGVNANAQASQRRRLDDERSDAPGLVGGERVHRIDDDRLDAALPLGADAGVEDRVEEALGLAGPGSGRDDAGSRPFAREPAERLFLVAVGPETEGQVREEFGVGPRSPEWQFERQPGALDQRVRRLDEVLDEAVERLRRRGERRPQLVPQAGLDFAREDRRQHPRRPSSRCGLRRTPMRADSRPRGRRSGTVRHRSA